MLANDYLWVLGTLLGLVYLVLHVVLVVLSPSIRPGLPQESVYVTPFVDDPIALPDDLSGPGTVDLTVVIPAYNEAVRLPAMLEEAIDYLERSKAQTYEVLVVDDGSSDDTSQVAYDVASQLYTKYRNALHGTIKIVTMQLNRGKGAAVRHGTLHASGRRILFADADGATSFRDVALLNAEMDRLAMAQSSVSEASKSSPNTEQGDKSETSTRSLNEDKEDKPVKRKTQVESAQRPPTTTEPHGVVVGSRAHMVQTEAVVKRSFLRNLLMRAFHTYLYVLGIHHIRDTQCGFKMVSRASARHIYPLLHSSGWIFDCELLLLALFSDIPAREVNVTWHEVSGSKVDIVKDSIRMANDLLLIRLNYLLGRWQKPEKVAVTMEGKKDQ